MQGRCYRAACCCVWTVLHNEIEKKIKKTAYKAHREGTGIYRERTRAMPMRTHTLRKTLCIDWFAIGTCCSVPDLTRAQLTCCLPNNTQGLWEDAVNWRHGTRNKQMSCDVAWLSRRRRYTRNLEISANCTFVFEFLERPLPDHLGYDVVQFKWCQMQDTVTNQRSTLPSHAFFETVTCSRGKRFCLLVFSESWYDCK